MERQHSSATSVEATARWRWSDIDTVLLDMDGTLLDLRFDNYFWLELVPQRYAELHAIELNAAREALVPMFAAHQGTLNWYCTEFWTRELGLDIARMKHDVGHHVRFLDGAEEFLRTLRAWGKRLVLVTNAHRDSLRVKVGRTDLGAYFDRLTSSHEYGAPKEHPRFWHSLREQLDFAPSRTLFVDDSLAVVKAACAEGLEHLVMVAQPDSTQPPRVITDFPSVRRVVELLDR